MIFFRFGVHLPDGYFRAFPPRPVGWTHLVMNYIGPNEGQGIRVYYDGKEAASETTKITASHSAGDGRVLVGRIYTDRDELYASVQVDELTFFNKTLNTAAIMAMYKSV